MDPSLGMGGCVFASLGSEISGRRHSPQAGKRRLHKRNSQEMQALACSQQSKDRGRPFWPRTRLSAPGAALPKVLSRGRFPSGPRCSNDGGISASSEAFPAFEGACSTRS